MVATIVTHMQIALNNHSGRTPNRNANYKKVATIQIFENVTEVKYQSVIEKAQLPPSGAQFFEYSLNEPATAITEVSLVEVKKAVRTISESAILVNESLARKVTHALSDSTTAITEDLDSLKRVSRTFSESKTIDEFLQKSVKRIRTLTSEPATVITENLDANTIFPKILSPETTVITEISLVKVAKKIRNIIETPTTIEESLVHLKAAELGEAHIPITESLQSTRVFAHSVSEPATAITESLARKVIHQLSQTTPITEGLAKTRTAVHEFTEHTPLGIPWPGGLSYTSTSFSHSFIPIIHEILQKLVHHILTQNVSITEQLLRVLTISRTLTDVTSITELLAPTRFYYRSINPRSFTEDSFNTIDSFNIPSGDVTEITEELEAFVLPYWQKVLIEPAIEITESLDALKIPAPIVVTPSPSGVGGRRRRRRPGWMGRIPTILQHRPITPEEKAEPEERIPILTEIDIKEPAIQISESLNAIKITSPLPIPIIPPSPRVASIPEPEPYFEPIPLLQASTSLLPLDQEPESQQPNALQPEKEPEERLEPVSISIIPPKKSKGAASLNTLEKLIVLSELEALI